MIPGYARGTVVWLSSLSFDAGLPAIRVKSSSQQQRVCLLARSTERGPHLAVTFAQPVRLLEVILDLRGVRAAEDVDLRSSSSTTRFG